MDWISLMSDLTRRLEQATAGSRELSNEVLKHFGWSFNHAREEIFNQFTNVWISPENVFHDERYLPNPAVSVDDALMMVPEGYLCTVCRGVGGVMNGSAYVSHPDDEIVDPWVRAATPALALCIAILKADQGVKDDG